PDGKHLAFACQVISEDQRAFLPGEVVVWDAATGRLAYSLKTRGKGLNALPSGLEAVAYSRDGKWLAAAGHGTLTVWDTKTRQEAFSFFLTPPNAGPHISRIDFSPDGLLAAVGSDMTVKLWDLGTGKVRRVLQGQAGYRAPVAFNKAGTLLAS